MPDPAPEPTADCAPPPVASPAETLPPTSEPAAAPAAPGPLPEVPGYEVEWVLGRGGMGVVYRARQVGLNRLVALKMVLAGAHATAGELVWFLAEAETAARLHHHGIAQIYDTGRANGLPYFAMELVDGGSLADRLARPAGGPLPPADAARIALQLAEAVAHAHACGVIHRDLKPANILLTADGTPKITDFGLARRLEAGAGLTQTGSVLGTPAYMPPEQARGDLKTVGPAGDVYSLGAVLYELLTGRPPFRADSPLSTLSLVLSAPPDRPRAVNVAVPRDLETVCLKCMEKAPERRYASAEALADDLRRFLDGRAILARRATAAEKLARWAKRNPAAAALTAAVFVSLAAGAGASLTFAARAADRARDAADKAREAEESAADARARRQEAAAAARLLAEQGYVSDMRLIGSTAEDGQPERLQQLLLRHRPADGRADLRNFEWRYWRRLTPLLRFPASPDLDTNSALAFAPDGDHLLVGSRDGVHRVDLRTGLRVPPPIPHKSVHWHLAVSPDGGAVLSSSDDGSVKLWEAGTCRLTENFGARGDGSPVVAFSPDGRFFAIADAPGATLYDARTRVRLRALAGPGGRVRTVAFSPDGRRIAVAAYDRPVHVYDTETGHLARECHVLSTGTGPITELAFSPGGRRIVAATTDALVL